MSLAADIRRLSAAGDGDLVQMMTVTAVGDDGLTVNLGTDLNPINGVPCMDYYSPRRVGDQVAVLMLGPGRWLVLGCPGHVPPDAAPTEATIKRWIADAIPPPIDVSFGDAPPSGSGWQQAAVLPFVRDDGNGGRSLYLQTAEAASPSPPPPKTPDPVTIHPVAHGSYRTNGQKDDGIIQGPASAFGGSSARWTGVLFYGGAIADACAGKTVARMDVTFARKSSPHGWNRSVSLHLGTHGAKNKTRITNLSHTYVPGGLQRGERKTWRLHDAVVNALKSGDQAGLGITTTDPNDYLIATDGSGDIKITFA